MVWPFLFFSSLDKSTDWAIFMNNAKQNKDDNAVNARQIARAEKQRSS